MPKKGYKQSPEHLEKNRLARMDQHPSDETKEKMRLAHSGEKNHNFGKKFSDETRAKISAAAMGRNKGVPRPEHVKKAIGDAHRGSNHYNFGKQLSDDVKEKIRISTSGDKNHNFGKVFSNETKEKLAACHIGTTIPEDIRIKMSIAHQGVTEEEWKGFSSLRGYCPKWTDPLLKVRKRVRANYNNSCILCHKTMEENNGSFMSVHHVTRKKDSCCEGDKGDWLFATLCGTCHSKYGRDVDFENELRIIILRDYDGKCMPTLDEYRKLYPDGTNGDRLWGSRNGS